MKKTLLTLSFLVFLAIIAAAIPASANLLANGSFETPVVDPTSQCGPFANCHGFHSENGYPVSDSNIGGWSVIGRSDVTCVGSVCIPNGAPAPVMLMTNNYTEPFGQTQDTLFFHVQDGNQAVDLTGEGNQGNNGIKQTITLGAGEYLLSFWLGHQDSSAPGYTEGPASISLWINGVEQQVYSNDLNTSHDVTWERFSYDFNASGDTTIAFLNETATGNHYAGLDNVSLVATPEPASLVLMVAGLAGIVTRRRFRK